MPHSAPPGVSAPQQIPGRGALSSFEGGASSSSCSGGGAAPLAGTAAASAAAQTPGSGAGGGGSSLPNQGPKGGAEMLSRTAPSSHGGASLDNLPPDLMPLLKEIWKK